MSNHDNIDSPTKMLIGTIPFFASSSAASLRFLNVWLDEANVDAHNTHRTFLRKNAVFLVAPFISLPFR